MRKNRLVISEECRSRWSRLLKKRELIAYYLLCVKKKNDVWNTGDIVDVLVNELLLNNKTAYNVFRRLKRIGLLVRVGEYMYKCIDFTEYFDELLKSYVCVKKLRRKP
ncbi:hypothetical protein [Staphylothermus marinus]|uniref:hypothetical protein n=1 Tax=Staphylothermus marinus TaxID=2280 RepID=UPI000322C8DF|nr:hypothetical protein [Staphylothermus marinus]